MKTKLIVLVSILFALARFFVPIIPVLPTMEGSYEALAHVWVGGLIAIGLYDWHSILGKARFYLYTGLAISGVELVMFLHQTGVL